MPDAVISIVGGKDTEVAGNTIMGTDAVNAIWIAESADTRLIGNHAMHLMTPGAVLVGTGAGNTDFHANRAH